MQRNNIIENIVELKDSFVKRLWDKDIKDHNLLYVFCVSSLRVFIAILRDLRNGQINLRGMSLVYTTLLSIVPLLAISFSVLKAFEVHNQIEPILLELLDPLGADKSQEITNSLIGFVDNVKVGVLGSVGLGFLLYSVVSLMQKIESAFNYTWNVSKSRSFAERFSDYLSVILIGPVLIFASMGLSSSINNTTFVQAITGFNGLSFFFEFITLIIPYLLFVMAFTMIYIYMPNAKVQFKAALVGGLVSGAMWKLLGILFKVFISGSAQYAAIYSAFATVVLLMIWLYLAWLILLIGASISYYVQNPSNQGLARANIRLSNRVKEKLTFLVLDIIGKTHYDGGKPLNLEQISDKLKISVRSVERVIDCLEKGFVIATITSKKTANCYVPLKPFEETSVWEVIQIIRSDSEHESLKFEKLLGNSHVDKLYSKGQDALEKIYKSETLKDLIMSNAKKGKKK